MEKQYVLLMGHTPSELHEQVNERLNDDWRLSGVHQCAMACQSTAHHPCEGEMYYCYTQAMTK